MIFVRLSKFRKKPTKELIAEVIKNKENLAKEGIKFLSYWTLGRYDTVNIFEAPDEKAAMKVALIFGDVVASETLVAAPWEEAAKLVE